MTPVEVADETTAVLAELEALGAHLVVDQDLGLHVYTSPERPDIGTLAQRIPGVHVALVTVLLAEATARDDQ